MGFGKVTKFPALSFLFVTSGADISHFERNSSLLMFYTANRQF